MGDGFLDEVEKQIEEFSVKKSQKINKNVRKDYDFKNYKDYMSGEIGHHRMYGYERDFIHTIKCDCGASMSVKTVDYANKYRMFGEDDYYSVYTFSCAQCSRIWKIKGRPVEIIIKMEY